MISYYKSKHPGLFLYLALVTLSVLTFLFLKISTLHIGVLSIFWGCFILLRTISLYEVSAHFIQFAKSKGASKCNNNSALPHDLLHRKNGENHFKRGVFAMQSIHDRSLLWFSVAIIYASYYLYLSYGSITQNILMQNILTLFMIGASFWAGQTYAYSNKASKLLITIFSMLFIISIFQINFTEITYTYELLTLHSLSSIKNSAAPILAILVVYSVGILFNSFTRGINYTINALAGFTLICMLIFVSILFESSHQSIAIWLSGWSLFSIFWIRSYCCSHKKYTIYQCE